MIRAAEPMLYIVPSDSALVVDAQVDPIHIDSVRVGQEAVLRFSAFNTRTTPELFGTVSKVAPDAVVDEATKRSYYRAEVLLDEGELLKLEGLDLVANAVRCRSGELLAQFGQIEEAKHPQPVVDGDHDDVALFRQNRSVIIVCRTPGEGAAVNPEQDGPVAALCRGPHGGGIDIEKEAVFIHFT